MNQTMKSAALRHDKATPRYTSYPPATLFQNDVNGGTLGEWMGKRPDGQAVSLYVHVPFCKSLCYYCGCYTSITHKTDRIQGYLNTLYKEMDMWRQDDAPLPVNHIHFGGGSPTMLEPWQFAEMMARTRSAFSVDPAVDMAIEADPRNLTQEKVDGYARYGMTRISLGVQDFNQQVMGAVNRSQHVSLTASAMLWARQAGIESVNFDLIYGLPGQTVETILNTIDRAIMLAPDRIAFFGYAHVPWMKKHMQMIGGLALPDASLRYDMTQAGRERLIQAGYHSVGIDHFVKASDPMYAALTQGTIHRNFQGYTTDQAPYLLGLGLSSISQTPMGFAQNTTDPQAYKTMIDQGQPPVARGVARSFDDIVAGDVIEQIMCHMRIDLAEITKKYALPAAYFQSAVQKLATLVKDGLLHRDGHMFTIHGKAPFIARLAAQAFDTRTLEQEQRHARTV